MNIYKSLVDVAQANPGHTAVIDGNSKYTYGELLQAIEGMAALVAAETDRDIVGVFLPTGAAFVISTYACFRGNFGMLPFNLLAPPRDLLFAIKDSGIDTVITCEAFLPKLKSMPLKVIVMEEVARHIEAGVEPPLAKLRSRTPAGAENLAFLLYTSGTTGDPKGVRLSHKNVLSNIEDMLSVINLGPDDVVLGVLPLFHTFALTANMGAGLHCGGTFITHQRFNPEATLQAIEQHKVTLLIAVPSMHRVLNALQQAKGYDVSSLRLAIAGGEPLPPRVEEDFKRVFGIDLLQGYGLTETSPVVSFNRPDANRPQTAGTPLPQVRAKVVDEHGKELPTGEIGELLVRGPNVMQGYHNQPEETAKAMDRGWFRTGDMASIDADGYIKITGRKKDLIIVGGMNVYPAEVEGVIDRHPGVMMAAAIGETDEMRGESVKAIVVPRDPRLLGTEEAFSFAKQMAEAASAAGLAAGAGQLPAEMPWPDLAALETDLKQFCTEQLAVFKRPRTWEFRASLPIGPTGKVARKLLK